MEPSRWQSAAPGGKAPRKKRRSSPLPGAAVPPGRASRRAGVSQSCRRLLFGSAGPRGPEAGSLKRKCSVKTLPKIREHSEVTEVSYSCSQSNQVNVKETTDFGKKKKIEESTVLLKESLIINSESNESLKNAEVTSSTGMTLPTGVSTFLLECLDVDSTADYNAGTSDSLNSCPSPETFRDDGSERSNFYSEDSGKYKNSTLLDSSKAVTIDKMPQISNLSAILEPVREDFRDQYTRRKRPSNSNYSSSALSVSTTLAGKKVCKITAGRERTPDLKTGMRCSSPLGPETKPDNQTAKPKMLKCKRKEKNSNALEEGTSSSFSRLDAPGNTAAKSVGLLTAEVLPSKQTDAVVENILAFPSVVASILEFMDTGLKENIRVLLEAGDRNHWSSKSLCVANKKSAPLSELHHARGTPGFTKFQLTQKRSGFPKECLKILLRVPKIGSTVNTDETSGFQQESTEEITVLLLWQGGETELLTSN